MSQLDATKLANAEVDLAFDDSELQAYGEVFLKELRESWTSISQGMARAATLFVLLATLFYLLTLPDVVAEVSFGPVRLADLTLVLEFLPLITAYLYFDFVLLAYRWRNSKEVFRRLMERLHPGVYDANFELLIQPRLPSFTGQSDHHYRMLGTELAYQRLHIVISAYVLPLLMAAVFPVTFEVLAYKFLLQHLPGTATILSAIGALILVGLALSTYKVRYWPRPQS